MSLLDDLFDGSIGMPQFLRDTMEYKDKYFLAGKQNKIRADGRYSKDQKWMKPKRKKHCKKKK